MANPAGQRHALIGCYGQHRRSSALTDYSYRFIALVDLWLVYLQPWNARQRLLATSKLRHIQESSNKMRGRGYDFLSNAISGGSSTSRNVEAKYTLTWEPFLAYNYALYASMLLKFIRRAAKDFNFAGQQNGHFDLLWRVLVFFMPNHSSTGPLWQARSSY